MCYVYAGGENDKKSEYWDKNKLYVDIRELHLVVNVVDTLGG